MKIKWWCFDVTWSVAGEFNNFIHGDYINDGCILHFVLISQTWKLISGWVFLESNLISQRLLSAKRFLLWEIDNDVGLIVLGWMEWGRSNDFGSISLLLCQQKRTILLLPIVIFPQVCTEWSFWVLSLLEILFDSACCYFDFVSVLARVQCCFHVIIFVIGLVIFTAATVFFRRWIELGSGITTTEDLSCDLWAMNCRGGRFRFISTELI